MAVKDWFRPPRHLVILFLGIMLVLMGALAWLGWRLLLQDRALAEQHIRDRLERAADVVASELRQRLVEVKGQLERLLAAPDTELAPDALRYAEQFASDALIVVLEAETLDAYPAHRLLFYPIALSVGEPSTALFAGGESLEFRQQDYVGAGRVFRRIAMSEDVGLRAAALLRLARVQRKAGQLDSALATYDSLASLDEAFTQGLPAPLVARFASLDLLAEAARSDELRREARALHGDLQSGKWRLARAQFEFYTSEVCGWIDCEVNRSPAAPHDVTPAAALAEAVTALRDRHGSNTIGVLEAATGRIEWIDQQPLFVLSLVSAERTVSLLGGSEHLRRDWLGAVGSVIERENVEVSLADANGKAVIPPSTADTPMRAVRSAAESGLPWTLNVVSADPNADLAQLAERRRLLLLVLATLALFVAVGLYAVTRGVTRELEVARLQSDFVAAVSHEFRTPLTSLRQLAELLSSGRVTSDDRRAQYYDVMRRESERLNRLVEGLLDFGRMEAGAMEFYWKSVAITDLVRNVVQEFQVEVKDSGYQVELAEDGYGTVRADAEALSRAVWNLLDNAVKYSPECATVRVAVKCSDGKAAISVRDQGAGISPAEQSVIFKKFVRGASSENRATKGTGIGLAMVHHIVHAHGGEIRVESEPGAGSTFTILLTVEE